MRGFAVCDHIYKYNMYININNTYSYTLDFVLILINNEYILRQAGTEIQTA